MTSKRPNVLIFLMDTQPVRNMTCYGFPMNTTPNVQRIADEGLVYERHYVTGAWTVPSHASLFTGKYQCGHGAGVQYEFLSPTFPTMAEVLAQAGYQTVGFSNNSWVNQDETNIARGFERWIMIPRPKGQNVQIGPEDDFVLAAEVDSGSAATVDRVQQWLAEERRPDSPFFMFINCVEPHLRVWAPEPFRSRFLLPGVTEAQAREVNQDVFAERLGMVPDRPDGRMTAQDWAILKSLYDGNTACLDQRMGLLFDHLRQAGILDDTLLIITSDHGDLLERKGHMGHHLSLFDDLTHTPLIVRLPGTVPAGQRFEGLVQICDWLPTFLDMLGIDDEGLAAEMQGVSLVPTWREEPVRDWAMAEYQKGIQTVERALRRKDDFEYRPWLRRQKTLWLGSYKYHWFSDGCDLLFDLAADPGERTNLIEGQPALAAEMRKRLEGCLLLLKHHDRGDKMRNHGFRNVRWNNVARLAALGLYRDVSQQG